MEILSQLGSLLLGAVPTMILFVLLVIAYGALVRRPLEKTLAERRVRTTGAVEQAKGAIAAAEAETAVYESKLRAARQQLLADREQRLHERHQERDRSLAQTRERAAAKVDTAKSEIASSAEVAARQIEGSIAELGERIVKALLPKGTGMDEVRP